MTAPLGKTTFGVTVWPVPAGRTPGQQTGLEHLTWGGPGDAIHLHAGGTSDQRAEYYGASTGAVSRPCQNDTEAQYAADAYLRQRVTAALAPGTARATSDWAEEILRAAGAVSHATAADVRRAAEDTYLSADGSRGEAWAQYDALQAAKHVIAAAAASSDPKVQAALLTYREARDHADRLYAAAAGLHDEEAREWVDADVADHEAGVLDEAYQKTWEAARQQHDVAVRKALRQLGTDFVRAHRAELYAADPARFNSITSARWLARISPPAAPAGPGAALARASRQPAQQKARRAGGRRQ